MPKARPRSRIGTPRKPRIGGWWGGKPTERGSSLIDSNRSGRASRDQGAEDAAPAREVTDLGHGLVVDAGVDEALEPRPRRVDHAERGVAGAGQCGGRLGQLPQQIVQRELRAQCDAGRDEALQALLFWAGVVTGVDAIAARPHAPWRYGAR